VAYAGVQVQHVDPMGIEHWVIACDRLFEDALQQRCGGEAEDARLAQLGAAGTLIERFDASPRTVVSVYRVAP
jgi:hypothetical protein